ncbi:MAG: site-specific integrase [Rhizobiaceae bacterium]
MADIRKRKGAKGIQYQVRYASLAAPSGYAYKTFDTRKEAVEFRDRCGALKGGPRASRKAVTVADAVDRWLDVCEKEGRDGRDPVTRYTLKGYRQRAETITEYAWDKPLADLTPPDIVAFRSWLLKTQSRDKARKVLSIFHSAMIEMKTQGLLSHDIASGIGIRGDSRYDAPVRVPTERDIKSLLEAADRLANARNAKISDAWRRYRPMLYLAADTGMRPQEYVAVSRSNIAISGVTVDRALERGGDTISVTKTPAGRRVIDISSHVHDMVEHYIRTYAADSSFDLAFPTASGRWVDPENWNKRGFGAACIEAGLFEVVTRNGKDYERPILKPYDLRHFYASMLIERRENLKRIQYLMGHRDIQTTFKVYGHLIERAETSKERSLGLLEFLN